MRALSITGKLLLTLLLLLALFWAQQHWRFYRALGGNHFARAARLWPINADGWRLLAQQMSTPPAAALQAAHHAVADDPADWQNWSALAQLQLEQGNLAAAQDSARAMSRVVAGYAPHWRYANLLLVAGDTPGFWQQVIQALRFAPPDDIAPALRQMWRIADGNQTQFDQAVAAASAGALDRSQSARLAIATTEFYVDRNLVAAAAPWWQLALANPDASPIALRFAGNLYLAQLADTAASTTALQIWRDGERRGLFAPDSGPTAANWVTSGTTGALAWQLCTDCGPWVSYTGGDFSASFHGNESDTLVLARQRLLLAPATRFALRYAASFQNVSLASVPFAASGIHVRVTDKAGHVLCDGAGLFTTPSKPALWRLEIVYQRPLGSVPVQGTVNVQHMALVVMPGAVPGLAAAKP